MFLPPQPRFSRDLSAECYLGESGSQICPHGLLFDIWWLRSVEREAEPTPVVSHNNCRSDMDRGWELSHDDGWAYEIGPMFKAKITKKHRSRIGVLARESQMLHYGDPLTPSPFRLSV